MSLQPRAIGSVHEETARVARAAFPKGNFFIQLRDELGSLYEDSTFADLFPRRGQPAESPWRLALVTVFQFMEGLTDRQAADAVRSRIDWKYVLGLELTDPGFDFSVLCGFRTRVLAGNAGNGKGANGEVEQQFLSVLLDRCKTRGWLKARGTQRTDSTHVLAAIRTLNRVELVGETLRSALNTLATVAPEWLPTQISPDWLDRYGQRVENYRLPKDPMEREQLAQTIGADGSRLLTALYAPGAPTWLREVPAVQTLRKVWVQQYLVQDGQIRFREVKDMPPATMLICSPYDPQAHYATKRETHWTGYKVHLTETCEAGAGAGAGMGMQQERPHLITHVETTLATTPDYAMVDPIHSALAAKEVLPADHLLDGGYVDAEHLVTSQVEHGVVICGPVRTDSSQQARAGQGFGVSCFAVDWETHRVTCPQGHQSQKWTPSRDRHGNATIQVRFAQANCLSCAVRVQCTQAQRGARKVTLRPWAEYIALQAARERQTTDAFKVQYSQRAGIEGTLSQGVRAFELRRIRYKGIAKARLQHIAIAVAINLVRLMAWLAGTPLAQMRRSRFAALAFA